MITLPWFAPVLGWFRTNPRNVWLIAGLVAALVAALWLYNSGKRDAERKADAARQVEIITALQSDAAADQKGTALAQQHAEVAAQQKEELINAVSKIPDSAPAPAAVAAGCIELCQAGRAASDIPACQLVAEQVRTCPPR